MTLCRGSTARDLPFLHRLYNTALAANSWESNTGERCRDGSSILTMSIMCGFIACSPAANEFVSGRTVDDARYVYPSEPVRKEC